MIKEISSRALRLVAPVVLGAAAAVLTTVMMGRAEERAQAGATEAQQPSDSKSAPIQPRAEGKPSGKIEELERRLVELEASRAAQVEGAGTPGSEPSGAPPILDPEEVARGLQEEHDALLAKHFAEPLDPLWSPGATSAFKKDLAAVMEQQEGKVVGVECKTTSCIATLEWSSYEAAQREYSSLLMHRYEVNCARRVWVPEPEDHEARYNVEAIFDCSKQRPQY